jgi:hypothetical protein
MSEIRLKSEMYCQILVSPGMGATLQLFLEMRVLITELFYARQQQGEKQKEEKREG